MPSLITPSSPPLHALRCPNAEYQGCHEVLLSNEQTSISVGATLSHTLFCATSINACSNHGNVEMDVRDARWESAPGSPGLGTTTIVISGIGHGTDQLVVTATAEDGTKALFLLLITRAAAVRHHLPN